MSDDRNEDVVDDVYARVVLAGLPAMARAVSLDDALGLLAQIDDPKVARRRFLLNGMASAAGRCLRVTVSEREAAARPWWKRRSKLAQSGAWFSPVFPDGLGAGETAAGQAMSAYASGHDDDAKALLEPWCASDRLLWEDDEYAHLLVGLLVNFRAAHRQLHEIGTVSSEVWL